MALPPQTDLGRGSTANAGPDYDKINTQIEHLILLILVCMVVCLFAWQMIAIYIAHLRRLACFNSSTQTYFSRTSRIWALLKKHVLYAPLFHIVHSQGIQIRAWNLGVVPKRFHVLLIAGLVTMNAILVVIGIPFSSSFDDFASVLQNRSGSIVAVNLIPLAISAGRNNPLIVLTRVPFDTWNLFHRWLARIVVIESIVHALMFIIPVVKQGGFQGFQQAVQRNLHNISGLLAVSCAVVLLLHSSAVIRHASYEIFHYAHILVAAAFFAGLLIHLQTFPHIVYVISAVIAWGTSRIIGFLTIGYRNIGRRGTTAYVEVLPGDALRVTISMTRPWTFKPGQHLFISIPAVDFGTSHPFSVAWSECDASLLAEKSLKLSQSGKIMPEVSPISLIISRRKGFTNRLYQKVASRTYRNMTFQAYVHGPFGGLQPLDSYGTIVLICGGVGITHMTSYLPHLVAGYANATAAVRRLSLVWVVPTWDNLEWIRPWVKTILEMERCAEVLQVRIHITRPESGSVVRYQTNPVIQVNKGRPDVCQILDEEVSQQIGTMAVMVCGPGSLSDIVRQECRSRQTSQSNIEFFEEGFSW